VNYAVIVTILDNVAKQSKAGASLKSSNKKGPKLTLTPFSVGFKEESHPDEEKGKIKHLSHDMNAAMVSHSHSIVA